MIALWSRAIRTPGTCRCISCSANTPAVTRRAGATGLKGAWVFGTPTSTFVYTTVFAAGLAIDAKAKRSRNEQWDSAFETIREELRALQTPADRNSTGNVHGRDTGRPAEAIPSDVEWDDVFKVIGMDMIDDAVFEKRQIESDTLVIPEVLWDLLHADARSDGPSLLDWPASTGPGPGSRYNLPPQSLWALERHISSVAHLTSHETQKVKREILANLRAVQTTRKEEWPEDETSIRPGPKFKAEPRYLQDNDGDFHHITKQLNVAIKKLFEEYHDKRKSPEYIAVATAKICHNLLISSAAPNLQTFNILLTGFQKWDQPRLVDDVIKGMYVCKIRPNEITCAAILDHYTEMQRPVEFSQFVAKMRGAGDALMMARPDITVNEAGGNRLVRISETQVYQKVYPTPMVFHALMYGVLKFAGFERAMDIYYEMKEDGWGLDLLSLSRLLDDCLHRADWQGGQIVWEEIANIQGRVNPNVLAKAYAQFLSLCSVAQKPAAFNTVLSDVIRRGYNRKAILKSVKEMTNVVRPDKGYLAPAFTADNLLIAVSDYMKTGEAAEAETAPFFEESKAGSTPGNAQSQKQGIDEQVDPWDTWVEQELGEPTSGKTMARNEAAKAEIAPFLESPNAGSIPQNAKPRKQSTTEKPDAWAVWMEHELGEAVAGEPSTPNENESTTKRSRGS
ncbi:uncharacterized protein N0V89_006122 [Didymosphaeria variabile]|uniref:Pentatricopeptide repeat protein n=1 Tax=Didymosphaeria variabile TaxID=1932322 RepID=A0A9W8XMM4_9PLEO|nr:uncharacterized protein N0V89_006122 [Didymosphaeria variabile]KAJ4354386.1 hypothetical protein N0V89_006122 [Didymosphaeria variabile]